MKKESFVSSHNFHGLFDFREKKRTDTEDYEKKAREEIIKICKESKTFENRAIGIVKTLEPFFNYVDKVILPEEQAIQIKQDLLTCASIKDKKEFLERVMIIIKPLIELRKKHAAEFEDAAVKAGNEESGFTAINRLLSYGKYEHTIHIHASAGRTVEKKMVLYRSGFRELAKIVELDPEVHEITATSHLVASHEPFFERMGFTVSNISRAFRKEHFSKEKRKIKMAKISREDFLRNFLKE